MKVKFYLLPILAFMIFAATSCPEDRNVYLVNIKVENLDNSGEDVRISEEPINRNAFVIGVKYLVGNSPNDKDPYPYNKKPSYSNLMILNFPGNPTVFCNDAFDEDHPADSDVTKFFKFSASNSDGDYSMLLVLKEPPAAGTYSFRVVFDCPNNVVIRKDTEPVTLF